MTGSIVATDQPFNEQIDFFRQKKLVPTNKWDDLLRGDHDHGFMVAGANRGELLVDLRRAVDKAIATGSTLDTFRKDFDQIVRRYGWSYNGERGWRTETIYATNLSTSYAAGRYAQMTDPDMLRARPFWRYRHSDNVRNPRPEHQAQDGKVYRADDAFWKVWFPPNGWGCQCSVEAISARDLKRMGKDAPDTPPEDYADAKGIDRGFEYAPGESLAKGPAVRALAEGERLVEAERITPGVAADAPVEPRQSKVNDVRMTTRNRESALALTRNILGGDDRVFSIARGAATLPLRINAEALVDKFNKAGQLDRLRFMPQLVEMLADPDEVFLGFVRMSDGTVRLSVRVLAQLIAGRNRHFMLVAGAGEDGNLAAITFIPAAGRRIAYPEGQRWGRRLYRRGEAITAPVKPASEGSQNGAVSPTKAEN